jgi:4-amino-4-deoxy-L-arabinose transferase-like glycosyltransferase
VRKLDLVPVVSYIHVMPSLVEKVSAKPLTTVILLGLILFLSGNWILPLMDRDEPRFAEASREMLQRGDLIIPWFNGQYRFDKPPLIYWCQIASYRVLGENAFAARLPSALFATATAVLLLFWGRRLGNEKVGFYSAIIFITCLQLLIHGRLAVTDMPMIFFVSAAVWSGWEMTRRQPGPQKRWWWMFYLSLGLGFLAKGPVAWLPLGGLFLGRWLWPTEFQFSARTVVCGALVTLFLIGLWGVPALMATRGQFFSVGIGHHVVFRSLGIMEGHGGPGWIGFILTLPLYLLTFFFSFFPWSLKMPGALRSWWPSRRQDLLGWYLLVQAGLVFATFTLVRTKLPHYTLPAFPVLSLWLAWRIAGEPGSAKWISIRAAAMCAVALLVTLGGFVAAQPYFVAANLWRQARPFCSSQMEFTTVDFNEPSLVWEFRRELTNYIQQLTLEQAGPFLQKEGPRILILPTRQFTSELKKLATNSMTFRSPGIDTARFRRIDLTAVVKTE